MNFSPLNQNTKDETEPRRERYRQKCKQLEALEKLIERDAPLYFALTDGGEIVAALEAVAGQLLDEIAELEQMGVTAGGQA